MSKRASETPAEPCERFAKKPRELSVATCGRKAVSINERLAVELLEKLLQFVHRGCQENYVEWPQRVVSDSIDAIVIDRRFDLRYVCLRWDNIVHHSTQLQFEYRGSFQLHSGSAILSKRRDDIDLLKSTLRDESKSERQGVWCNLIDCIQSLYVTSCHYADSPSLLRCLTNATADITQPCDLYLNFIADDLYGARSMIKDPDADFAKIFPNLALRHLTLDFDTTWGDDENFREQFEDVKRVTKYSLDVGKQSFGSLRVELMALDGMPEDWVCESLHTLRLGLNPPHYPFGADWSDEEIKVMFEKQRNLPRLFPKLESIAISAIRCPLVDFTLLHGMDHLKKLQVRLSPIAQTGRLENDWRMCALPNIESLEIRLPRRAFAMRLSEFVPNVKQLQVEVEQEDACIALLGEMNGGFPKLSEMSLKFGYHNELPPMTDVVALFSALCKLPALVSLNFELYRCRSADWCRPGDFSLLQALPVSLQRASLRYCLLPAPMTAHEGAVTFIFNPNVPNAEEAIYKTWFQTAMHHLCELPNLERFYCRILAPSFHAAVSLASKWNKSSAAAIANFGVANVIYIAGSTESYSSIEPGQTYRACDTLKFRFTLAPMPGLANRQFGTRVFTFELEFPEQSHCHRLAADAPDDDDDVYN